jgi:hypothetical protein
MHFEDTNKVRILTGERLDSLIFKGFSPDEGLVGLVHAAGFEPATPSV